MCLQTATGAAATTGAATTATTLTTASAAATTAATPAHTDAAVVVEYENVTDTIKRRLESPVNTPETEKPEFKKSKIPLALKSPVPIKKEIKEGGHRSRGSSVERCAPVGPPAGPTVPEGSMAGPIVSESPPAGPVTPKGFMAGPATPVSPPAGQTAPAGPQAGPTAPEGPPAGSATHAGSPKSPRNNSSTFNLLTDSELFTQISNNNLQSRPAPVPDHPQAEPCTVVEVKEHEIVKSTVSPIEQEIYPFEAIDAVVEFIPQSVETVNIIDDTENESPRESDEEDVPLGDDGRRRTVDLGTEPQTFVIEVKTLEHRMKPTLGILKQKNRSDDDKPKAMRVALVGVPDLIPDAEKEDNDGGTAPPLGRHHDELREYLVLDDVPHDLAALPEPSATDSCAHDAHGKHDKHEKHDKHDDTLVTSASIPEKMMSESGGSEVKEEVIYSEVEDPPQVNDLYVYGLFFKLISVRLRFADYRYTSFLKSWGRLLLSSGTKRKAKKQISRDSARRGDVGTLIMTSVSFLSLPT